MSLVEPADSPPWESPQWQEAVSQNPGLAPFFDNLESFVELPEGVEKLRELVLDLAVRGQLSERDEADGLASELVDAMLAHKEANPPPGRQGRGKSRDEGGEPLPYEIPGSWIETRIGDVLHVIRGSSPRPKGDPRYFATERTQYHWIKISDIRKHSRDGLLLDTDEFLTEAGKDKSVMLPKGTLVLTNSATIGVPIVLGMGGGCIHDGYLAFPSFPHDYLDQQYLLVVLKTLKKYAVRQARGLAQLNLNTGIVRAFPFGVPPLAEQRRIVSKVEGLMSLCDTLEDQRRARESVRERASRSVLASLPTAPPATNTSSHRKLGIPTATKNLTSAWQRLSDHFEVLLDQPKTLTHLRQSILQLAVQGKLVPQDPNDEPAGELLERIKSERERRVKAKKIKKPKPTEQLNNERLSSIPESWVWVRFGELAESMNNGLYKPSRFYSTDGTACIRMYNIQDGVLDFSRLRRLDLTKEELDQFQVQQADLIVNRVNSRELVGKTAIVNNLAEPMVYEAMNIRVRLVEKEQIPEYLNLLMQTDTVRELFQSDAKQASGQASISQPQVANIAVPLPPKAEQKRIVSKASVLLSQLDELSARLRSRQSATDALLTALIDQILKDTK